MSACLCGIIDLFISHETALVDIFLLTLAYSKYVCAPTQCPSVPIM